MLAHERIASNQAIQAIQATGVTTKPIASCRAYDYSDCLFIYITSSFLDATQNMIDHWVRMARTQWQSC